VQNADKVKEVLIETADYFTTEREEGAGVDNAKVGGASFFLLGPLCGSQQSREVWPIPEDLGYAWLPLFSQTCCTTFEMI
jgi:hypothetical protein